MGHKKSNPALVTSLRGVVEPRGFAPEAQFPSLLDHEAGNHTGLMYSKGQQWPWTL